MEGTDPKDEEIALSRPHSPDAPFSALVFKIVNDTHGDLTYMRVYSGTLERGSRLLNLGNNKKENISRIFEMHAKDRDALDSCEAGQIVAVVGLKNSMTGDTLCSEADPIILERMHFPDPVISIRRGAQPLMTARSLATHWSPFDAKIHHSARSITMRRARPSSLAWANSILRSSRTVSS